MKIWKIQNKAVYLYQKQGIAQSVERHHNMVEVGKILIWAYDLFGNNERIVSEIVKNGILKHKSE